MRWVLGFDGGGTKTVGVLMNESGAILTEARSGPSNPSRIGIPAAFAAVRDAAQQAATLANIKLTQIAALCAGLAGTSRSDVAEEMRTLLALEFSQARIQLCTDLDLALAATGSAASSGPALVLIAGTGSAAVGRGKNGEVMRVGGYGPLNSDEGSAYDIGRRALQSVTSENGATGANSALGEKILAELAVSDLAEAQRRAQSTPEEVYARLFPVVSAAADFGDPAAQVILRVAAGELAVLVATLADRLSLKGDEFLLAKTGGMMGRCNYFDAQVDERLHLIVPGARIVALAMAPAEAAARLALQLLPALERAEN
jgi:N-acetylmuramic acid 6-phosphate etherase